MAYCTECGAEYRDGKFCGACGVELPQALPKALPETSPEGGEEKTAFSIIPVIVLLVVAVAVFLCVSGPSSMIGSRGCFFFPLVAGGIWKR
jgi:uncharacterized membrane protein YvbJ